MSTIRNRSTSQHEAERKARAYETAGVCSLVAVLLLLANAGEAERGLIHLTRLSLSEAGLGLALTGGSWLLASIFCVRRALLLRLGSEHFGKRREFEAEVEWAEKFLRLRDPDEEPPQELERHLWRPRKDDLDAPPAPQASTPWRI